MVGALEGARATLGQGERTALVRQQPPAAQRALVDGTAHERVTEAEAARDVGVADEVAAQEVVERGHRDLLAHAGRRGGQLGLERVARHRGAREHEARVAGELRELPRERGRDRARDLDAGQRHRRPGRDAPRGAGELLEVERVPAAGGEDRVGGVADQLTRLGLGQRHELDPRDPLQCGRDPLGHLARAHREREQRRRRRRPAQQRAEQLERAGVGPVQVVEHEHERLRAGELLEQRPHGAVQAVSLRTRRGPARERGEDVARSARVSSSSPARRRGSRP